MRTHYCGDLTEQQDGQSVKLAGWVHRRRDHGGVIFLDLRDRRGLVQIVVHPDEQPEAYRAAEKVRGEYVIAVEGLVRRRPPGSENPKLATGHVEVAASDIEVLSESETPPFPLEDRVEVGEDVRLRYRYLDLRREEMQRVLKLRHRTISAIRRYFDEEGFTEVETPLLNKSTPEGARDYLVPSRLQPGTFFALTQSPQLFKQLLMVAGIDRYYQIVRCFRDEDPRADRQPDFTQLDMEMSFVDEAMVQETVEAMMAAAVRAATGAEIARPFPRVDFAEAVTRFGNDRPDMRFGMEISELSDIFAETQIQVFRKTLDKGGSARGILVRGAGFGRRDFDELADAARKLGAGGLAWVTYEAEGVSSPLAKFLTDREIEGLRERFGAEQGDSVLIVCDKPRVAAEVLGTLRVRLAGRLNLIPEHDPGDPASWNFLWIVNPPLVDFNEKESRWDPLHHPFTAPLPDDEHLIESDPGAVRARAYDVVLNGWEVAGGSIRIHRPDLQRRVFSLIGIDDEHAERRF
ncbi:MAG: aspartate--tRNA ligase, partial [Actinomycetota bacterium]